MNIFDNNSSLLVTGGTGSFGKCLISNVLKSNLGEIRIFSRDEEKQDKMRSEFNDSKLKFIIGDIRDSNSIDLAAKGVDYIFHASALKQVPSCEFYPMEAVKTNILGINNLIDSAIKHKIKKVIALSTDKSVYPINVMGLTKALMEKIALSRTMLNDDLKTIICITRYGNVMGSRGSVIPAFINKIKNKERLTITDKNMTRFMMTLDEAVKLVLFAFKNGNQGDIFIQKSPATNIITLAKALCKINKVELDYELIGPRHGEKKHEVLINKEEMSKAIDMENYYKIPKDQRDIYYEKYLNEGDKSVNSFVEYTSENTHQLNIEETIQKINEMKIYN